MMLSRTPRALALTVTIAVAVSTVPLLARDKDNREKQAKDQMKQESFEPRLRRSSQMIGMTVKKADGKDIGVVEELVLGMDKKKISYGVLSFGGVMDMGEKFFAIPWDAFEVSSKKEGEDVLVLDIDKSELEDAPGFNYQDWPNTANPRWSEDVDMHWQEKAEKGRQRRHEAMQRERQMSEKDRGRDRDRKGEMRDERRAMRDRNREDRSEGRRKWRDDSQRDLGQYRKLSELLGLEVQNKDGKQLGYIEDIMVDTREGCLGFAVLGFDGYLGLGQDYTAIPWQALNLQERKDLAVLDSDKDQLKKHTFDNDKYPDFDREYSAKLHREYGQDPYWARRGYTAREQQEDQQAWIKGSPHNKLYKEDDVREYSGKIVSVGTFQPEQGDRTGLRIRIRTDDGKMKTAYAGPREFYNDQKVRFYPNDKVTFRGHGTKKGPETFILIKEIEKDGKTYSVREDDGTPTWSVSRRKQR